MNNYPYIIASLPDYVLDFEKKDCDYRSVRDDIYEQLEPLDRRMVEWMEYGFNDENLTTHFYSTCRKCKNNFIREYFGFDHKLRTEKVAFLKKEETGDYFEEKAALLKIFGNKNILEREKELDMLLWNKISDIVVFDVLDFDIILAFLAKANIIARWNKLDRESGEKLFRQFVNEVNDTYNASKNKNNI
jgi:hypothetical protein